MAAGLSTFALILTIAGDRIISYSTLRSMQSWIFALGSIVMILLVVIALRRRTPFFSVLAGGAAAGLPWLVVLTYLVWAGR